MAYISEGSGNRRGTGSTTMSPLSWAFLNQLNIRSTLNCKEVTMIPSINSYLKFVDRCYKAIVHTFPLISYSIGPATFRHIAALMFAKRMEDINLKSSGIRSTVETRVYIPPGTQIFQPILDILSSVGVTKIPETSTIYIPMHPLPNSVKREDVSYDYELEIRKGCAFDWEKLSMDAKSEMELLNKPVESTNGVHAKVTKTNYYEQYDKLKGRSKKPATKKSASTKATSVNDEEMNGDSVSNSSVGSQISKLENEETDLTLEEVIRKMRENEFRRRDPVRWVVSDENTRFQDPAFGQYLGWFEGEWEAYKKMTDHIKGKILMDSKWPVSPAGSTAWILDVCRGSNGYFVQMPLSTISLADQALALLIPMSSWHLHDQSRIVEHWYSASHAIEDNYDPLAQWIDKATRLKDFS
ncbi:uncharacterized protein CANTADRAFT_26578, partial [Suhomyces tanzawaensis NRRL Y-17324]